MTLDEARRIVKRQSGRYSDWVHASAVVYESYMRAHHPETPLIGDAAPGKESIMRRQQRMQKTYDTIDRLYRQVVTRDQSAARYHEGWTNENRTSGMGAQPGSPVGPSLVLELPGHSSNYFILDLGPGKVGVMCSSEIAGKIDMAAIAEGRRPLPSAENMRQRRAVTTVSDAAAVRQRRDVDEARQMAQLRAINAANKLFWSTNAGK